MTDNHFPLETLHAEAISPDMPECTAILVVRGPQPGVMYELGRLFPQDQKRIFYVEDPVQNKLLSIISAAHIMHIPCIILGGEDCPPPEGFFEFGNGHASLISQGSGEDGFVSHFTGSKTLQHFAWLGFQNYLTDNATLETIGTRFFESLRLGEFRNNPRSAEPLLRDASVHFVDLKAVRHSDAPDGLGMSPNGLYSEEICTLGRFIGLSTRFHLSVIYGYPSSAKNNSLVSKLVAQVIWHITEGLAVSFPEYPEKDPSRFQRKVVQLGDGGQEMVFLQSRQSGRWWIEVPNLKELSSPMLISCSIDDYKTACRGEIPLKWLFFYQKSNNFS